MGPDLYAATAARGGLLLRDGIRRACGGADEHDGATGGGQSYGGATAVAATSDRRSRVHGAPGTVGPQRVQRAGDGVNH
jgi:hypothetical protein